MLNLNELYSYGTPWRVSYNLADASATQDLVIPTPLRTGSLNIANQRFQERNGIIILGFAYTFRASAADVGFELVSIDDAYDPGTTRTFSIFNVKAQAAGVLNLSVSPCFIPLTPANPFASTPVGGASGATLRLVATATKPTSGTLLIWGIHGTMDFGKWGYSGSPAFFPST
jgi:hypothetical protein